MLFRIMFLGFASFICWAVYSADMGKNNLVFDYVKGLPYGDKMGHFFLMGILAMLANLALGYKTISVLKKPVWLGSLLVGIVVLLEELTQIYVPLRTFDLGDLAADFVGIAFFSWLGYRYLYTSRKNRSF